MKKALNLFKINIQSIKNLDTIYSAIENQITSIIDISDILRSEIVLAVSALDHFIHEIVLIGMLEIFKGSRIATDQYKNFQVSLNCLKELTILTNLSDFEPILKNEIRNKHGYKSFQNSKSIRDAINLVCSKNLWEDVGNIISLNTKDVKNQLDLIVDRRNKIAREMDIDPTYGTKWPINKTQVYNIINFIDKIAETIYSVVK